MSESKHTPGPWYFVGQVKTVGAGEDACELWCGNVVPAPWRGDVCAIQSADHIQGISREETEANARLIAAAPDLLAALRLVLGRQLLDRDHDVLDAVIDAIARAEGRS